MLCCAELIFVVLGIEGLTIPIPEQQTMFSVTLDNGIDYIRTPYIVFEDGAKVNQEFSLYVQCHGLNWFADGLLQRRAA